MEIVINFSGGKDSSAMLALIAERYSARYKCHCVFADTGWEHKDAEEWSRYIVGKFGFPLHVVQNPNKDFFTMVRKHCISRSKMGGIRLLLPMHDAERALKGAVADVNNLCLQPRASTLLSMLPSGRSATFPAWHPGR